MKREKMILFQLISGCNKYSVEENYLPTKPAGFVYININHISQ